MVWFSCLHRLYIVLYCCRRLSFTLASQCHVIPPSSHASTFTPFVFLLPCHFVCALLLLPCHRCCSFVSLQYICFLKFELITTVMSSLRQFFKVIMTVGLTTVLESSITIVKSPMCNNALTKHFGRTTMTMVALCPSSRMETINDAKTYER